MSGVHHFETGPAPYAVRAEDSRGRRLSEATHAFRNPFQRDRDRVIHSRAFRRLEYKTQVFLNGTGDHLRTRLTHTMEVAAIARTIGRRLRINEDLVEAVALAHDLGHTPFGHVGERMLNRLLEGLGGFDHNTQSLRVVDLLEKKYPWGEGLNLTWEVRSGLVKRRGPAPAKLDGIPLPRQPSLEAQVADISDDLAYYAHDLDDGLEAGLIHVEQLEDVTLWCLAREEARAGGGDPAAEYFIPFVVRCLIDRLVGDAISHSLARLKALAPRSPDDVASAAEPVAGFSPRFREAVTELRTFLFQHVYWHPEILEVSERMGRVVRDLFRHFVRRPDELGSGARGRIEQDGLERAVADYIAGMTDRYALLIHTRLGPAGTGS
ncbi:MAG: deoxyguanosinetriphosphate triphosphohydrolase [Kiritimatiellaeota bacterium]|nr:deoxyguanosinetriphosphate triphosphohydrolase [Kiritimatiellota bacterium]